MMTSVKDVSRRLAERCLQVCLMLLPGGREHGSEYLCASVSGGHGDSLKVHLNGNHPGQWRDWATDSDKGDLLDLWAKARNLPPGEALRQAKEWVGIVEPQRRKPKEYTKPPPRKLPAPTPEGRAFKYLTNERKLTRETLGAFKVGVDAKRKAIVFVSENLAGEVVNRSYRTMDKDFQQEKGAAPCLYGWQALPKSALDSRTVLLTEGQIDAMTWHQWGIPALSVPSGKNPDWIDYEWDNLEAFERIYLAFDMDASGREIAELAIARLGPERCFVVETPHKDANECLCAGCTADDAAAWVTAARMPKVEALLLASEIEDRLIAELMPKPKPFTLNIFDLNWEEESGLYFRPGELTVWTGHSHAGKSTFLNYLMLCMLAQPNPDGSRSSVFIGSYEVKIETTLRRMMTAVMAPMGIRPEPQHARTFLMEYGESIVFSDVLGFIDRDRLFQHLRVSFRRFGVRHFVIDSLVKIQGLEEDYLAQSQFINDLIAFARGAGAHVHLVAHPRKASSDKPGMVDIKGSGVLKDCADNAVAICRNLEKMEASMEGELTPEMRAQYDTEIRVYKQKESGWIGAFYLKFDNRGFTYSKSQKPEKPKPNGRRPYKE